jgi:hypothetical protein
VTTLKDYNVLVQAAPYEGPPRPCQRCGVMTSRTADVIVKTEVNREPITAFLCRPCTEELLAGPKARS